jgi:hypothetical protein
VREFADDPAAKCELCGQWMPAALLTEHMALHGYDPALFGDAEIEDHTGEPS